MQEAVMKKTNFLRGGILKSNVRSSPSLLFRKCLTMKREIYREACRLFCRIVLIITRTKTQLI